MEDLHREQPPVDGLELVGHARRSRSAPGRRRRRPPEPRPQLRVAGELASRAASASVSPIGSRKPLSPSRDDGRRAARARRDDRPPAASASIATTGVPSFADVSSERVERPRTSRGCASESRRSGSARRRRARARAPRPRADLAVADEHEQRVDAVVPERAQRADEVERPLDRGQPPRPADREGVLASAELGSDRASRLVVGLAPRRQVEAVGDDDEAAGRGDAEADEVVAHLVADGDQRPGREREPRSIRRKTRSQRLLK